jgi:hypothetical protein
MTEFELLKKSQDECEMACRTQQKKGRWVETMDQSVTVKCGFVFDMPEDAEKYSDTCRQYLLAIRKTNEYIEKEIDEENARRKIQEQK